MSVPRADRSRAGAPKFAPAVTRCTLASAPARALSRAASRRASYIVSETGVCVPASAGDDVPDRELCWPCVVGTGLLSNARRAARSLRGKRSRDSLSWRHSRTALWLLTILQPGTNLPFCGRSSGLPRLAGLAPLTRSVNECVEICVLPSWRAPHGTGKRLSPPVPRLFRVIPCSSSELHHSYPCYARNAHDNRDSALACELLSAV